MDEREWLAERASVLQCALRHIAAAWHRKHSSSVAGSWVHCSEHFCRMAHDAVEGRYEAASRTDHGVVVSLRPKDPTALVAAVERVPDDDVGAVSFKEAFAAHEPPPPVRKPRTFSEEARKRMSLAAKQRWEQVPIEERKRRGRLMRREDAS